MHAFINALIHTLIHSSCLIPILHALYACMCSDLTACMYACVLCMRGTYSPMRLTLSPTFGYSIRAFWK